MDREPNYFFKTIGNDSVLQIIEYVWSYYKRFRTTFALFHKLGLVSKHFRDIFQIFKKSHPESTSVEYFNSARVAPSFINFPLTLLDRGIISQFSLSYTTPATVTTGSIRENISISLYSSKFKKLKGHVWISIYYLLDVLYNIAASLQKGPGLRCPVTLNCECIKKSNDYAFWFPVVTLVQIVESHAFATRLFSCTLEIPNVGTIEGIKPKTNGLQESFDILEKITKISKQKHGAQKTFGYIQLGVLQFIEALADLDNYEQFKALENFY